MHNMVKSLLKYLLARAGYKIHKIPGRLGSVPDPTLIYKVDVIFDVGANEGQYAKEVRSIGYKGKIVSFEPQRLAHKLLMKNSRKDDNWVVHPPVALGSKRVIRDMYISKNSVSSSLYKITNVHTDAAESSETMTHETVQINMIDELYNNYIDKDSIVMLKIDVQGYELEVLRGSLSFLSRCRLIKLELSTKNLYEHQPLYFEIDKFLRENQYSLVDLVPGFRDKTGILLQYDAVYARNC